MKSIHTSNFGLGVRLLGVHILIPDAYIPPNMYVADRILVVMDEGAESDKRFYNSTTSAAAASHSHRPTGVSSLMFMLLLLLVSTSLMALTWFLMKRATDCSQHNSTVQQCQGWLKLLWTNGPPPT